MEYAQEPIEPTQPQEPPKPMKEEIKPRTIPIKTAAEECIMYMKKTKTASIIAILSFLIIVSGSIIDTIVSGAFAVVATGIMSYYLIKSQMKMKELERKYCYTEILLKRSRV